MPYRLLTTCLLLTAVTFLPGCRSSKSEAPAVVVPADFELSLSQGGGITGRYDGYTVYADGRVESWSGIGASRDVQPFTTLSEDQLRTLYQHVLDADFFNQDLSGRGNMTARLSVTADGQTHRATWIPTVEGVEEPASPVEVLYRTCRDLIRTAGTAQ